MPVVGGAEEKKGGGRGGEPRSVATGPLDPKSADQAVGAEPISLVMVVLVALASVDSVSASDGSRP